MLDRIDEIISHRPGDLQSKPIEEIRELRAEAQQLETGLSYIRRIVQGRLDIVGAEISRRAAGGEPSDLSDVVARLPEILSDRVRAPGMGRLPQVLAPAHMDELVADVDEIVHVDQLTSIGELADDELQELADRLSTYEREVSARRRSLHDVIDALQSDLIRRYKSGEASVETLLQ